MTITTTGSAEETLQQILVSIGAGDRVRGNPAYHYLARTPQIFQAAEGAALVPPKSIQLEITNTCSTGCRMCSRFTWTRHPEYRPERELTTQEMVRLFQESAAAGVETIMWTGGEPMTHPDLELLLAEARHAGLRVGTYSNGVGITERRAEAILAHADFLRISLDDVPATEAGSTRRSPVRVVLPMAGEAGDVAPAVQRSLENLSAARSRLGESRCRLAIAYTIQRANVLEVPEMVRWVQQSPLARSLDLFATFKLAHGKGPFRCTLEQLAWLQEHVLENDGLVNSPHCNLRYLRDLFLPMLDAEDITEGTPTRRYYATHPTTCWTTQLFSLIDAFGDVYVCCHLYDDNGLYDSPIRKGNCLGNVKSQGLMGVWRSAEYQAARRRLQVIQPEGPCAACTRHFLPNTLLSRLHSDLFMPLVAEYGPSEGARRYAELVSRFPEEACWF